MSSPRGNALSDVKIANDAQSSDEVLFFVDGIDDIELVANESHCDPVLAPTYTIPVVNAGLGSVKVALGLVEKHSSYPLIATISGVNFLVMLGMNLRYTMDGIKGTLSYLRNRTIPAGWEKISPSKNNLALAMTFTTAISKAGTDAILNRYFVMRLPLKFKFTDTINMTGWAAFGWTMSGFTFVGTLTSGGMAMYVKLRNIVFGNKKPEYSNKFSRYASPIIGTTLSLTYAVSNLGGTIVSVTSTFGITSTPGIAGVCALGLVNVVNGQFTNLPFNVNAVDKLCGVFTPKQGELPAYKNPYTIVSFSFAVAAAGLIGYSSRELTRMLLNHSLETLGVNCSSITDPIVEGISDTTILCNILWVGGALTPLFYDAATGIVNTFSNCCKRPQMEEKMREVEPLIPSDDLGENGDDDFEIVIDDAASIMVDTDGRLEGGPHRLFQPKDAGQPVDAAEHKDNRSCVIL